MLIWFSRLLRWGLGIIFLVLGYLFSDDNSAWAFFLFGVVFIFTGFLKPKRCLDDKCNN